MDVTGKQTALPDSIEIVKCRSNRNADSIEILNCPLRLCSPSSFSLARSAHPFPSIRFSFFILNIPFLSYKFYPLLIDRYRSYPRSIPLAHSLARMLAQLAPSYLSLALARHPLRQCSPCSFSFARSSRPCPSMCFSFFILNTLHFFYINFNLFNLIALARTLARMLALLALVLALAHACVTSS